MDRKKDKHYNPPKELPQGFWECLTPLAEWVKKQLVDAYDLGFFCGQMAMARHYHDHNDPPAAGAVALS